MSNSILLPGLCCVLVSTAAEEVSMEVREGTAFFIMVLKGILFDRV